MEHIFQIGINVEDEKIIKSVEENAERQIIGNLTEKIEEIICNKGGWYRSSGKEYAPLKEMVLDKVDSILNENKDFILSEASKILADKLARSKRGKELLESMEETT